MHDIDIFDILRTKLSDKEKLDLIQMLQWKRLSIQAKQSNQFKKYFDDVVQKQIHKLNPVIFSLNNNDKDSNDRVKEITKNFLNTPTKYRKNVLILCYEDELNYFPIFLH